MPATSGEQFGTELLIFPMLQSVYMEFISVQYITVQYSLVELHMSFVELQKLNNARVVQCACSTETVCIGWLIVFRLSSLELHVVKQYCCYSTHAAGQLMCHILVNDSGIIVSNI